MRMCQAAENGVECWRAATERILTPAFWYDGIFHPMCEYWLCKPCEVKLQEYRRELREERARRLVA